MRLSTKHLKDFRKHHYVVVPDFLTVSLQKQLLGDLQRLRAVEEQSRFVKIQTVVSRRSDVKKHDHGDDAGDANCGDDVDRSRVDGRIRVDNDKNDVESDDANVHRKGGKNDSVSVPVDRSHDWDWDFESCTLLSARGRLLLDFPPNKERTELYKVLTRLRLDVSKHCRLDLENRIVELQYAYCKSQNGDRCCSSCLCVCVPIHVVWCGAVSCHVMLSPSHWIVDYCIVLFFADPSLGEMKRSMDWAEEGDAQDRMIRITIFLNDGRDPTSKGGDGIVRLYPGTRGVVNVLPQPGMLVVMYCPMVAYEIVSARAERFAVDAWLHKPMTEKRKEEVWETMTEPERREFLEALKDPNRFRK